MERFKINANLINEIFHEPDHAVAKEKIRAILTENGDALPKIVKAFFEIAEKAHERAVMERYLRKIKDIIDGETRTTDFSDIDLNTWQEQSDIFMQSFWNINENKNDVENVSFKYWGSFSSEVPRQLITRFTKKGEWILDPFLGSGTTLIECKRQGRNGIGVELLENVAKKAQAAIDQEPNNHSVTTKVIVGDNRDIDYFKEFLSLGISKAQFAILHPPYWDVIKFSDKREDLSNAKTLNHFLEMLGESVENVYPALEKERFIALVIGDRFLNGEWLPVGFRSMDEFLKRNFKLKSIVVKNFQRSKGKRDGENLLKYRALISGFYIVNHEYIFLFKK